MASVEKILYKQQQAMMSIHKALTNYKKLGQARMTVAVTHNRISLLEGLFATVQDLDADLHCAVEEPTRSKHPYFAEQQFAQCETVYQETLDFMHEVIAGLAPNPAVSSPSEKSAGFLAPRSISHLPRLELPTFDGSFDRWETFRDRFTSMIVDDQSLSDVERMHYLCSILTGDASKAVSHLPVTGANYKIAWNIIKSRYENKRRLISTHLQNLFSIPHVACEASTSLQAFRDQANMAIMALRNLGRPVDTWGDILVYFVTERLDKSSRKAWELKLSDSSEFPDYIELDKFLESRIRALDAMLPIKSGSNSVTSVMKPCKLRHVSAHVATTGKFVCPRCKKNHLLYQCVSFLAETPDKRHAFIKSIKRCFNCLAANHATKECKNEHRCKECSAKHHTLLHLTARKSSPCDESSTSISTSKATLDNNITEITSDLSSHIISNVAASTVNVLLATARVQVHSSQGRFTIARALLDQGSAATLISENLAQTLRLKRIHKGVRVSGIGDTQSFSRHVACVSVSSSSNRESVYSTTAIILPSLTKYRPNRVAVQSNWSHLADL